MSVAKIEQDIKLLEDSLQEIEITIPDPIERNEYKKEIQRKIKKLNRTKNSLEQLEKEQQELKQLKHEFSQGDEQNEKQVFFEQAEATVFSCPSNTDTTNIHLEEQIENDWDTPSSTGSDSWDDDSCRSISENIEVAEDLEDSIKIEANISNPQTSHQIYLSRREIWISTVLVLLNFIFPYIYTRRWKPLCILFASVLSLGVLVSEEGALSIAPWVSVIDNGIAINKSKKKLKPKSS